LPTVNAGGSDDGRHVISKTPLHFHKRQVYILFPIKLCFFGWIGEANGDVGSSAAIAAGSLGKIPLNIAINNTANAWMHPQIRTQSCNHLATTIAELSAHDISLISFIQVVGQALGYDRGILHKPP
jgi:hypothetical protein